jgi:hypothetical protein
MNFEPMLNTIVGGLMVLITAIVVAIFTTAFNYRFQSKKSICKQLLMLISILYLLRSSLSNYLNFKIYSDILGEDELDLEETRRIKTLNEQIYSNIDNLYQIQQEIIGYFKDEFSSVSLIYDKLDKIEHFIWYQKMHFNDNKVVHDNQSSEEYSNELEIMLDKNLAPKIESLIALNLTILKIKSKRIKHYQKMLKQRIGE